MVEVNNYQMRMRQVIAFWRRRLAYATLLLTALAGSGKPVRCVEWESGGGNATINIGLTALMLWLKVRYRLEAVDI